MKVTGNDVGTVMKYSGHKTLESFSNYVHPTDEGRIVSMQALDNVDGILTAQGRVALRVFVMLRTSKSDHRSSE